MGGSSKPTTQAVNQTTTQKVENTPWAPAAAGLEDMIKQAQVAYAATPKTGTYVAPNADQLAAVNYLRDQAPATATGGAELRQLGLDQVSGKYLDPSTNPWIKQAVEAAQNPLRDQLDQNILSIGDAATMSGAYGGDRQALLKSTAHTGFEREALDAASKIYYQNYLNERQIQQNSGTLFSQANDLLLQPAQILDAIGGQQAAWDQQKKLSDIDAPWTGLDRLQQVLSSVTPYASSDSTGTQKGTTTGDNGVRSGGAAGGISGALGGAAAGSVFGPWGAGIGAVAGGLAGLFG